MPAAGSLNRHFSQDFDPEHPYVVDIAGVMGNVWKAGMVFGDGHMPQRNGGRLPDYYRK